VRRAGETPAGTDAASLMARLQQLTELDVADGVRRLGGDATLYVRLLRKFVQRQAAAAAEVGQAVERGDDDTAKRLLHTLKGVAGSIGASELASLAADAERQITTDGRPGQALMTSLANSLEQLVGQLAAALADDEQQVASALLSEDSVREMIADLQRQLEEFDTAADDTIEQLLDGVGEGGLRDSLVDARQALQKYDFEAARRALEPMETSR
jgi:HPt (histidine-containing phosphotransfer) domain-containing protein